MLAGTVIAVPRETNPGESRCALIPADAKQLIGLGAEVHVETNLGALAGWNDDEYRIAGASVAQERAALLAAGDIVLRVRRSAIEDVELLKPEGLHISFLNPFLEDRCLEAFASRRVSVISMHMIPRTTRAQGMDALSSQANLAGYVSVIMAAQHLNRAFPMMMTAAGTVQPARVLVIGAGVTGLQAIATAHRLGARVEAYDTRSAVEEQVRSLGARFLKIDIGAMIETRQGYAGALTESQLQLQRQLLARACAQADVVITAAQTFGKPAPILITNEIVARMKPGSVVVDTAIESGGNVQQVRRDEVEERSGIKIIGYANLAGFVSFTASQLYSANLVNLITEFWDKDRKKFVLRYDDEILSACLVADQGKIQISPPNDQPIWKQAT